MKRKIIFLSTIIFILATILIISLLIKNNSDNAISISEETYYKYDPSYREGTVKPKTPGNAKSEVFYDLDSNTVNNITKSVGIFDIDDLRYINADVLNFNLINLNGIEISPSDYNGSNFIIFFGDISAMEESEFFLNNWKTIIQKSETSIIEIYALDEDNVVEKFYNKIGLELSEDHKEKVVTTSDESLKYIYDFAISNFPSIFYIREDGSIAWYTTNAFTDYDTFNNYLNFAYSNAISETIDKDALYEAQYDTVETILSLEEDLVNDIDTLCPEDFDLLTFDAITYEFLNVAFHPSKFKTIEGNIVSGDYLRNKKYIVSYLIASEDPDLYTLSNTQELIKFAEKNDYELIFLLHDFGYDSPVDFYKKHKDTFKDYLVLNGDDLENLPYDFVYVQPSVLPSSFFVSDEGRIAGFIVKDYSNGLVERAADIYLGEEYSYERLK